MGQDSSIRVVYAGDDNVAGGIAVSALTLLRHHPGATITVLQDDWCEVSRQRLASATRGSDVECLAISSEAMPTATGVTRAAYLRLLIPEVLDSTGTAVYLDADTFVRRPFLDEMQQFSNSMVQSTGAVRDSETPFIAASEGLQSWRDDGLDPRAPYVNSGVLLMALDVWRSREIGRESLEWKRQHPKALHDQDALNAVLNGEVLLLPQKFNATVHMMRPTSAIYAFENVNEVDEARADPAVVHFTGAIKPWHRNSEAPFLSEWRDAARDLDWTRFGHSFTVRRRLERSLIRLIDSQRRR